MSEDLRRRLQLLEEDYPEQPPTAQQADLQEINALRSQLGLPAVDAHLHEVGVSVKEEIEETKVEPVPEKVPDHTEARAIFQAYLKKIEELNPLREYAEEVAEATGGRGQTPVRPLATMGNNGGPLLCDHCGKPIVLEGGNFHGVNADVAWAQNPVDDWKSWILGGMVVELQTNGTLRIYHGYPGHNNDHCCNIASREDEEARAKYDSSQRAVKSKILRPFIEQEFPHMTSDEQFELLNQILNTLFVYDPGIGINQPSKKS